MLDAHDGLDRPPGSISPPAPPVTIFLPVYNEAGSIADVLRDFHQEVVQPLGAELLVCEDGSTDGTPEVLRRVATEIPMRLVSGPHRKGYGGALRDGLTLVKTPYVFIADSDGQYAPSEFWKIWNTADSYDMVIGRKVERQERFYRTLLSRGFHLLIKAFTAVPLEDMDCGFRLIRKEMIPRVLPAVGSLRYSFLAEFSIVAYRQGFRIKEVPVEHRARIVGSTSIYSWNRLPWILMAQVTGLLRLARRLNRSEAEARRPARDGSGLSPER